MRYYKNFRTEEQVDLEDAQEYMMEHLGLSIKPLGNNGTTTLEQDEFLMEVTEWFYSGNWTLKEDKEEEDNWAIKQDMIYEDKLSEKLLGEV